MSYDLLAILYSKQMQNRSISTSGLRLLEPDGGIMSPQIALLLSHHAHHAFPSLFIYLGIYTLKLTEGVGLQNIHIQS